MKRAIFYIDGFNLYYNCLKGDKYKWLDLHGFCSSIAGSSYKVEVKYFTARVKPSEKDRSVHNRQDTYLTALKARGNVTIVEGHFNDSEKAMIVTRWPPEIESHCNKNGIPLPERIIVLKQEEKRSDVNLAVTLIKDSFENKFDEAFLITNDADQTCTVETVKSLGKVINVVFPFYEHWTQMTDEEGKPLVIVSSHLRGIATPNIRFIREANLSENQLPEKIRHGNRILLKPRSW